MTSRFTLVGINEEINACDCCGKSDLKCTMELQNAHGVVVNYGRDCGARALGWKVSADRAEKLVKGTARILEGAADDAWRAVCDGRCPAAPARMDGGAVEVWHTLYGNLPAGRPWAKIGKSRGHGLYWRVAA